MIIVESYLAEGPRSRRGGAPHEVQLHVTPSDLAKETDGAFIANGGCTHVSAETARRLCCDAGLVVVLEDDRGNVLDVGRRTRTVPAAIRRALNHRDQSQCAFPGCTHTLFLDAHHIQHWADGGETKIENLTLLCRRHHTFVHEHGFTLHFGEDGVPIFTAPNSRPLPRIWAPPPVPSDAVEALAERALAAGVDLGEVSLVPAAWNGEALDYDQIVHVLATRTLGELPHTDDPAVRHYASEVDDYELWLQSVRDEQCEQLEA